MISIAAIGGLSMALGGVKKVFIDGEAGTTGLQVQGRLKSRTDIELLTLPEDKRKDLTARQEAINEADAVILCLPDAAAIEAVALAAPDNDRTVFIDASTAHRTNPDWVYGFAEMRSGQRDGRPGRRCIVQVESRRPSQGGDRAHARPSLQAHVAACLKARLPRREDLL